MPKPLGVQDGRLAPCPSSPNCVCSDMPAGSHRIAAFRILGEAAVVWPKVCDAVAASTGVTVVRQTSDYLHATCRTRLLRFIDDLELHLRPEDGSIAVRSASRVGHSDLGTNRKRVEGVRRLLRSRGLVA
ncbi:MAG: DUF1499 domain-containing protein [Myxococcota bacterium]